MKEAQSSININTIKLLTERDLDNSEASKIVSDIRNRISQYDTSLLEAYFDILKNKDSVYLRIQFNGNNGGYYFHIPTGWVLSLVNRTPRIEIVQQRNCDKIYNRNFIASVYDSIKDSKNISKKEKIMNSRGMKKYGYRTLMCVKKSNGKSLLLAICRHISVLTDISIVTSSLTRSALLKSRSIASRYNMIYPNIYKMDKILKIVIISNEKDYFKKIKKLISSKKLEFKA